MQAPRSRRRTASLLPSTPMRVFPLPLVLGGLIAASGCADTQPMVPTPGDAPLLDIGLEETNGEVLIHFEGFTFWPLERGAFNSMTFIGQDWYARDVYWGLDAYFYRESAPPTSGNSAITLGGVYPVEGEWLFRKPVSDLRFSLRTGSTFQIACYTVAGTEVGRASVSGILTDDGYPLNGGPLPQLYPLHDVRIAGSGISRCAVRARGGMIDDIRFRLNQPDPVLKCLGSSGEENRVVRGEELVCTVEADGASVEIETWGFRGTDSRGQPYVFPTSEEGPITANPWRGKMALSGEVSVRARVGTGEFKELKARVTVAGRDWSSQPVAHTVRRVNYDEVRGRPGTPPEDPRSLHDLGVTLFTGDYLSPQEPGVVEFITDYGPNHYLAYLAHVPVELDISVLVHPQMTVGSTFYRQQRESARGVAHGSPCLQSRFEHYVGLILAHEGYPVSAQSHSGAYLREYQLRAGSQVEDLVVRNDQLPWLAGAYQSRLDPVQTEAASVSKREVDDSYPVRFGCTFNGIR
jgi:hypothetical protein